MSFNDVLAELPSLTLSQRQELIARALELDEPALSDAHLFLVEERLAAHRANPGTAKPLEAMKAQLRNRSKP